MNKTTNKYTPEVRERAVRMVLDGAGQHETRWSAIVAKAVTQNALRPMPVIWKFTTIRRQALDVSLEPKVSN